MFYKYNSKYLSTTNLDVLFRKNKQWRIQFTPERHCCLHLAPLHLQLNETKKDVCTCTHTVTQLRVKVYLTDAPQQCLLSHTSHMFMALSPSNFVLLGIVHVLFKYLWIARSCDTAQAGIKRCLHTAQQFSTVWGWYSLGRKHWQAPPSV